MNIKTIQTATLTKDDLREIIINYMLDHFGQNWANCEIDFIVETEYNDSLYGRAEEVFNRVELKEIS